MDKNFWPEKHEWGLVLAVAFIIAFYIFMGLCVSDKGFYFM